MDYFAGPVAASSIALIHFLQTKGSLDLLVIYHTFCHRAKERLTFTEFRVFFRNVFWQVRG